MPIYIKQALEVEAIQFTRQNLDIINEKFGKGKILVMIEKCLNGKMIGQIRTIEGTMFVNENDYIIKGIKGELYPCKTDIFEKTYKLKDKILDADKMFEKIGYKKLEVGDIVWYQKKTNFITKDIIFDLEKKIIHIEISHYDKKGNLIKIEGTLTLEELQAINRMMEELQWEKI